MYSPAGAWLRSLPLVLLIPFLLWQVYGLAAPLWDHGESMVSNFTITLIAGIYGAVVHFIAYALTGLPMFFVFKDPKHPLWTKPVALPVGTAIGGFVLCATLLVATSGEPESISVPIFIIGAAYGFCTALVAVRFGPKLRPSSR